MRTLDAVYPGIDATVVTHDRAMIAAATAMGYPTFDPIGDR